jgi:hypothetical protein
MKAELVNACTPDVQLTLSATEAGRLMAILGWLEVGPVQMRLVSELERLGIAQDESINAVFERKWDHRFTFQVVDD